MKLTTGSIQLALLVANVQAFYPYMPEWKSQPAYITVGESIDAVAELAAQNEAPSTPSIKIRQKGPREDMSHEDRLHHMASYINNKFKRKHPSPTSEKREIVKRTNTYSVVTAESPTATHSAPIDQDGTDYSYFTQVMVGSEQTPLYMLIDTGSSNSWVMSNDCASSACKLHNTFDPSSSTSYNATQDTFYYGYGSGNITGVYGTDVMSLAGYNVTLKFGLANTTSDDFNNFPFEGILGFGAASKENPTFMDVLVGEELMASNIFCVNLNRAAANETNDGEISFGAPDRSKYLGDITYSNLSSTDGQWAIAVDGVSIGGVSANITWTNKTSVIDTGSTYVYIPDADATEIHATIPDAVRASGSSYWTVPCNTTSNFTITFNSGTYNIPAEDWVVSAGTNTCASAIIPSSAFGNDDIWLFGDLLLKNVYTVFDINQSRIGFAEKGNGSTTVSAASADTTTSTAAAGASSTSDKKSLAVTYRSSHLGAVLAFILFIFFA